MNETASPGTLQTITTGSLFVIGIMAHEFGRYIPKTSIDGDEGDSNAPLLSNIIWWDNTISNLGIKFYNEILNS